MSSIESEDKFSILTKQEGIKGTSYKIQLAISGKEWIVRIWKGNKILESRSFKESSEKTPNQNEMVQFILNAIPIPNMNPMNIMNTIQSLIKEVLKERKELDFKSQSTYRFDKNREEYLNKNKLQELKRKKSFLKHIKGLILEEATANKVLSEYNKYPRHFPGILKIFEPTLKKIGDESILGHLNENQQKEKFQKVNSIQSYYNTLNTELSHINDEISKLGS